MYHVVLCFLLNKPFWAHFRSVKAKCQVGRGRWLGQDCTALHCISIYYFLVKPQIVVHHIPDFHSTVGFDARTCQTIVHIAKDVNHYSSMQ